MRDVEVRYNTFGRLNEAKDNVLVVCHALTGNARLDTWWSSILGPGKAFDTDKYLVVCANILGTEGGQEGGEEEKEHGRRNEVGTASRNSLLIEGSQY